MLKRGVSLVGMGWEYTDQARISARLGDGHKTIGLPLIDTSNPLIESTAATPGLPPSTLSRQPIVSNDGVGVRGLGHCRTLRARGACSDGAKRREGDPGA